LVYFGILYKEKSGTQDYITAACGDAVVQTGVEPVMGTLNFAHLCSTSNEKTDFGRKQRSRVTRLGELWPIWRFFLKKLQM
jgi:hypothetical protein